MKNKSKLPVDRKKIKLDIKKLTYYALIGVFALVFLGSAINIADYYIHSAEAGSDYNDLQNQLEQNKATLPPHTDPKPLPTDPVTGETIPTEPQILPEYLSFYEQNSDMVGWITIPDTKVNYPVLQTPNNKDYYLYRNFEKKWSDWGAIYAREVCDINLPSDNINLYGHHMTDGSMFAGLDKFKKEAFFKDHQTFTFDTLYEHHTYQIWAVFKTSANLDQGFPYHQFSDAATEEEFDAFVSTVKSMQFYETGVTPQFGDKMIALSTCEYSLDNGRFVVCAVRVDD